MGIDAINFNGQKKKQVVQQRKVNTQGDNITIPLRFKYEVPKFSFRGSQYQMRELMKENALDPLSRNFPVHNVKEIAADTGLSEKLVSTVISQESLRLDAYKDSAGFLTIGVGHNISADKSYKLGHHITKEQAYTLLRNDLMKAKTDLSSIVDVKNLSTGQREALVDLIFNTGKDRLANTKLVKYLNNGQFDAAASEFNFITTKGELVPGLCRRRIVDLNYFAQGTNKAAVKKAMKNLYARGLKKCEEKIKSARDMKTLVQCQKEKASFVSDSVRLMSSL
jgi:GH24 family phage-related lysozyme (muramidase)